jgi:hypothetical protein
LLLDHRFGDTQLVDAVVQGGDVLLDRLLLNPPGRVWLQTQGEQHVVALFGTLSREVRPLVLHHALSRLHGGVIVKQDLQGLTIASDASVSDVVFSESGAQITPQGLCFFGERGLHVNLKHEVNATSQIESQVHGRGMQRGQPSWRAWHQIECDDIVRVRSVGVERFLDGIFGLELLIVVDEACLEGVVVKTARLGVQACG